MSSALDIINDAATFGGVGDLYNPLSAEESQLGLRLLNNLLDTESTQEYSIFNITEGLIPVIVGTNTYTVGLGFGLNVAPTIITEITTVDPQSITHPMRMVGQQEWAVIRYKPSAGRPEAWYYSTGAPTGTIYVWPTPAFAGDVLHVWYGTLLVQFANLANVLIAPPGYEMFLITSVGELLAMWFNKDLSPAKKSKVIEYRNFARSTNRPTKVLQINVPVDEANHRYNIYSDNQ
jgi:hypothetical protein